MTPFESLLDQYPRIGIAGAPRTGKTTLSQAAAQRRAVIGTDAYKEMPWEDIPHRMIADVDGLKTYVIEGVQVGRALRKGLPVDALVYLDQPMVDQNPGQVAMGKGILTVLRDWVAKSEEELPPVFVRGQDGGFVAVPAGEIFGGEP